MIATLHVAPEVVELSRHACWLGNAFDEARSADPSLPRPFLKIVRRLAAATISPERVEDEFPDFRLGGASFRRRVQCDANGLGEWEA